MIQDVGLLLTVGFACFFPQVGPFMVTLWERGQRGGEQDAFPPPPHLLYMHFQGGNLCPALHCIMWDFLLTAPPPPQRYEGSISSPLLLLAAPGTQRYTSFAQGSSIQTSHYS